jgi:hypothetical protein
MDRAFASGSSGTPPSAPGSPSIGYPTAGNPSGGTPATKPGPYWYHMITEELLAVVSAAGLTPAQGTINQLLQALPAALASRPEMAKSLGANGYQKLPGGLIIQWGTVNVTTVSGTGGSTTVTFPIAFPNAHFCGLATQNQGAVISGGYVPYVQKSSLSQCIVWLDDAVSATAGTYPVFWVAIGN